MVGLDGRKGIRDTPSGNDEIYPDFLTSFDAQLFILDSIIDEIIALKKARLLECQRIN